MKYKDEEDGFKKNVHLTGAEGFDIALVLLRIERCKTNFVSITSLAKIYPMNPKDVKKGIKADVSGYPV